MLRSISLSSDHENLKILDSLLVTDNLASDSHYCTHSEVIPTPRPDFGNSGLVVPLRTNFFEVGRAIGMDNHHHCSSLPAPRCLLLVATDIISSHMQIPCLPSLDTDRLPSSSYSPVIINDKLDDL